METWDEFSASLREHPDWRERLRAEILDEEFLRLPALVRQNSIDIRQNSEDIRELKEVVARNSEDIRQNSADIRELRAVVAQNSADIRELRAVVAQNSADIRSLITVTANMANDVGKLKGDNLENWYRLRPGALNIRRLRRVRALGIHELIDLVELEDSGVITPEQARDLVALDLLVAGREGKADDSTDAYLACEVSWTIDDHDVTRAWERAGILRSLGYVTYPVVAGVLSGEGTRSLARQLEVGVVERPAP